MKQMRRSELLQTLKDAGRRGTAMSRGPRREHKFACSTCTELMYWLYCT